MDLIKKKPAFEAGRLFQNYHSINESQPCNCKLVSYQIWLQIPLTKSEELTDCNLY